MRKGIRKACFGQSDTAASSASARGKAAVKVRVLQVGRLEVGSHFGYDFELGMEPGSLVDGHLELARSLRGDNGVELEWVSRLWRDGWLAVLDWRLFQEDCQ